MFGIAIDRCRLGISSPSTSARTRNASARWAVRSAPVTPPRIVALARTPNVAAPAAMKSAEFMCAPSEVSATSKGISTACANWR